MLFIRQLCILSEHLAAIKEPKAKKVIRQGYHGDIVTDRNLQLDHYPRQVDKLFVLSNREREQVHELIKQAGIHPADYYQQNARVINVEEGEYIPAVVAAILQLEHV